MWAISVVLWLTERAALHLVAHVSVCMYVCVCVCVYVFFFVCVCLCMCAYVYVCMSLCVCVCMYVFVHHHALDMYVSSLVSVQFKLDSRKFQT